MIAMSRTLPAAMRRLLLTALALFVAVTALPAAAGQQNPDAARLTALLEPLRTYSADFTQQVVDGGGGNLQNASGHMWLSRPGRFNWQVDDPWRQTVVSDGQQVYLYDPDLEQVSIRPLDQRVTHTPALLLSGRADELTDNYRVSRRQQGTTEIFSLSPKAKDSLFEALELIFHSEQLAGINLTDSTGQRTEISFDNIEINPSISADRFSFDIPAGVDVIREGAG
ncbi:outer membrane lipoprotein chaperone LolA [Kushneria aurantia]|uniref:Outer-membrane lipoprotein carrier protein n=1 Tax=Kushneria aurantia TaxID=504092 RepID=A0ABV6G409_9GAMM|nr:outer membrane lipoprotein chaperone LolA [Kushneria aurantia]